MNIREARTWDQRRQAVVCAADRLAARHFSPELRVGLPALLSDQKVKGVEFRPMIVDGGLAVEEDGFRIFVRCDTDRSSEYAARLHAENGSRQLPSRIRFTIAHEIAHTFFFAVKGRSSPRELFKIGTREAAAEVERICNKAARHLLLPKELFALESVQRLDFTEPGVLRRLARKIGVSTNVLVYRIKDEKAWGSHVTGQGKIGAVICVRLTPSGEPLIDALSLHQKVTGMFPKEDQDPRLLFCIRKLFTPGGSEVFEYDLPYSSDPPVRQRCRFKREAARGGHLDTGYFVTLRLIGLPVGV